MLALGPILYMAARTRQRFIKEHGRLFLFSITWFCAALAPFMLREVVTWKTFPAPRYFYLPMAGFSVFVGVLCEELMREVRRFHAKAMRVLFTGFLVAGALYFFGMNTVNYCFMADKMARAWRVAQPRVDFLLHSPRPEDLRRYSFDLVPV